MSQHNAAGSNQGDHDLVSTDDELEEFRRRQEERAKWKREEDRSQSQKLAHSGCP